MRFSFGWWKCCCVQRTSLSLYFRINLLVTNSPSFSLSEITLFPLHSWRVVFITFYIDSSFLSARLKNWEYWKYWKMLKNIVPPPFGLYGFWWEIHCCLNNATPIYPTDPVDKVSFLSYSFQDFFFLLSLLLEVRLRCVLVWVSLGL